MRREGAPLRFVGILIALWVGGRGYWVLGGEDRPVPKVRSHETMPLHPRIGPATHVGIGTETGPGRPVLSRDRRIGKGQGRAGDGVRIVATVMPFQPRRDPSPMPTRQPDLHLSTAIIAPPEGGLLRRSLSGTAWLFIREGRGRGLASDGQLGGSQAGMRLDWLLDRRIGIGGRIATARDMPDTTEAALGLSLRPLPGQSLALTLERRIALGAEGRDAWAISASGGIWRTGLPLRLILDAYGQAGIVGAHRRDAFADGAVRLSRPIGSSDGPRLGLGVWGATQPGVGRLDVGPHLTVPVVVAGQRIGVALDARLRIAGAVAPGSGIALTLGSDF